MLRWCLLRSLLWRRLCRWCLLSRLCWRREVFTRLWFLLWLLRRILRHRWIHRRIAHIQHRSRVRQIPGPTCTTIKRAIVEAVAGKVVVTCLRVDKRKIGIQNALPASSNLVHTAVAEVRIPLFRDEILGACIGGARVEWDHVDALNVLNVTSKVRCVIDLVLKQDTSDLVDCGEDWRLVLIIRLEEEVVADTAGLQCEL